MKSVKYFYILLLCILFFSCDNLFNRKEEKKEEPVYVQDIAWTLETKNKGYTGNNHAYGRYYYIAEYNDSGEKYVYTKIDLQEGKKVWTTEGFADQGFIYYPIKANIQGKNCLIIGTYSNYILYIIDDETGENLATIVYFKEKKDEEYKAYRVSIEAGLIYKDNKIYWATNGENHEGIVKLDLENLDFTKDSDEKQYLKAESVWVNTDNKQGIMEHIKEKDGILYFVTYNNDWDNIFVTDSYCIIGAFDLSTDTIKWQKTSEKVTGYGLDNICIVDDKMYVIDQGQGCYDLETGETIWEQRLTLEEMKKEMSLDASMFCQGIEYNEGKFYFTNSAGWGSSSMSGIPQKYITNIQCMDKNGKFIWGDLPEHSGSLDTNPVIINGKCYVVSDHGLRVYNAKTGELLGVDKTINNTGLDYIASYDNKIIYFNYDYEKRKDILTAMNAE